jgi:uncharacterized UPF0160 family protein
MKNIQTQVAIVTHDGKFHLDEVMAVGILNYIQYSQAKIIRTRDSKLIDKADYVVDVGRVADHATKRYDHHQGIMRNKLYPANFTDEGKLIPYSSAGLIWFYYGRSYLTKKQISRCEIDKIWNFVDKEIMMTIDKIDNGIEFANNLSLNDIISSYNPTWNDPTTTIADHQLIKRDDETFKLAMKICIDYLNRKINYYSSIIKSEDIVKKSLMSSKFFFRTLFLKKGMPWQRHVWTHDPGPDFKILMVLHPSNIPGHWNILTVPISYERRYELPRLPIPKHWYGIGEKQLHDINIPGIFVTKNGNMIGASSYDNAVKIIEYLFKLTSY